MSQISESWSSKAPHEAVKPLQWLIGTWRSISAEGSFPSIPPFNYVEEIEFTSYGQPLLNYNSTSWHPDKKCPMHLERGFLRILPGSNKVAFMVAHNFGLTTLEEGEVMDGKLALSSKEISRMDFAKDPKVEKIERLFRLEGGKLEMELSMKTSNNDTCQHLKAVYEKVK